jgi:hypothetical protein
MIWRAKRRRRIAAGLSERRLWKEEYNQKIAEADKLYLHNFEAWQQAFTDIEDTYDVKRVLARAKSDDEAEKNTIDTQNKGGGVPARTAAEGDAGRRGRAAN